VGRGAPRLSRHNRAGVPEFLHALRPGHKRRRARDDAREPSRVRRAGREAHDPRAGDRRRGEAELRVGVVALAPIQDGGHVLDDDQQLLQGTERQGRDAVPVQQSGLPVDDEGSRKDLGENMATALKSYQLYIGGEWVDATSDEGLEVINPATEETIGSVPQGSIAAVDRAVAAARRAFEDGTWRRMPPRQRPDALLRLM